MKRIETEEQKERKKKKNTILVSGIMLVILILGTMGFAFSFSSLNSNGGGNPGAGEQDNQNPNSGYDSSLGKYYNKIGDQILYFSNSQQDVLDSKINIQKTLRDYSNQPLYIVSDDQIFINEVRSTLGLYSQRAQEACLGKCEKDLPVKTCSDNVIVIGQSGNNVAYQDNNCVFIEGNLKTVDAFLYKIFGIA